MSLRVSLHDTRRALPRPAHNARTSWAERAACIITLASDDGTRGSGECSPLPDFSPDTLEACKKALSTLDTSRIPACLEPGLAAATELARHSDQLPKALPAARAALEGALLDLWSRSASRPAWALLLDANSSLPAARQVSALLQGELEQAVPQALAASARGIAAFKLKIGRLGELQRELHTVRDLRAALGPSARLRLDANGNLTSELASEWLPRFAEHDVELVEEPCPRPWPGGLGVRARAR